MTGYRTGQLMSPAQLQLSLSPPGDVPPNFSHVGLTDLTCPEDATGIDQCHFNHETHGSFCIIPAGLYCCEFCHTIELKVLILTF